MGLAEVTSSGEAVVKTLKRIGLGLASLGIVVGLGAGCNGGSHPAATTISQCQASEGGVGRDIHIGIHNSLGENDCLSKGEIWYLSPPDPAGGAGMSSYIAPTCWISDHKYGDLVWTGQDQTFNDQGRSDTPSDQKECSLLAQDPYLGGPPPPNPNGQ